MEQDSDSFEFQPTSDKRALNGTLCSGCGAINTEVVRADILHLMTSEVLTLQPLPAWQHKDAGAWSTWGCTQGVTISNCPNTHTHTQRDGHHTTCLSLWTGKSAGRSTHTWALTKSVLTASSSFWVSSSILLMSSIVSSIHLSIQQNSWRWKLVNILFSCFKKINKH